MDRLLKLREPIALVALIGLAVNLLVALVSAGVYAGADVYGSFAAAAGAMSYRATDPVLAIVLGLAVAACVLVDRTRHARTLTLAGLIVLAASLLIALVFIFAGLGRTSSTSVVDTVDALIYLVAPVLVGIVLAGLLRQQPVSLPYPTGPAAELTGAQQQPAVPYPDQAALDQQARDAQYSPIWQVDSAAGAAWTTAGDAASGAPASGWGTPGQHGGWQPTGPENPPPPPPWNPNQS